MTDETVVYKREDILQVIRTVDYLVVSLDRIGSATFDRSEEEQALVLNRFMSPTVFKRLAAARRVLFDAFSSELGGDDRDDLERELADQEYWKP